MRKLARTMLAAVVTASLLLGTIGPTTGSASVEPAAKRRVCTPGYSP